MAFSWPPAAAAQPERAAGTDPRSRRRAKDGEGRRGNDTTRQRGKVALANLKSQTCETSRVGALSHPPGDTSPQGPYPPPLHRYWSNNQSANVAGPAREPRAKGDCASQGPTSGVICAA